MPPPKVRISALRSAPARFQGQVRDLAVRWVLEEVGTPYEVKLVGPEEQDSAAYRALHPFGKVPAYEDGEVALFESGAIVLHVAEKSALLPEDPAARARAKAWVFAALNSVDPDIIALGDIDHFAADEAWGKERRPALEGMVKTRLNDVASHLAGREFLVERFSAADIMMIMVLRALRHTPLVSDIPVLRAYRDRCEARPAFQRALKGQLDAFAAGDTRHA
jgi:glutathione S-transferase